LYGWLWRKLPGPWPVRTLEALLLIAAVCTLLITVVFPWVEPQLPFSDNVVDGGVPTSPTGTSPAGTEQAGTGTTPAPVTGGTDDGLAGDG
jgi:hypothetical protein